MTWLVACASLFATVLNIRRIRWSFAIWTATNATWAVYDFAHGLPAQGCLMCIYSALAIWGWHAWRPRRDDRVGTPGHTVAGEPTR